MHSDKCLLVVSCVQNISQSYERILVKFCGEVGHGSGRNRLDFISEIFVDVCRC